MLKEGGLTMKVINYSPAILLVIALISCSSPKKLNTTSSAIYEHIPQSIVYDTINEIFFYENSISSYIEVDAITKAGGFIKGDTITSEIYKNGYFVEGWNYVEFLKRKGIDVRFDKKSVSEFYDSLMQRSLRNGTYVDKTDINPYCGAYYKKFKLNVEVMYIDTIKQRVPLFLDCKQYDEYIREKKGRTYQFKPLPTYIITKFFSWEEM